MLAVAGAFCRGDVVRTKVGVRRGAKSCGAGLCPNTDTICLIGGDEKIGGYVRRRLTSKPFRKDGQRGLLSGKGRRINTSTDMERAAAARGHDKSYYAKRPAAGSKSGMGISEEERFSGQGGLNPSCWGPPGGRTRHPRSQPTTIIRGATLSIVAAKRNRE